MINYKIEQAENHDGESIYEVYKITLNDTTKETVQELIGIYYTMEQAVDQRDYLIEESIILNGIGIE